MFQGVTHHRIYFISGTSVAIEQTFGVWKRQFHLLHSEVQMNPEKTCQSIGACAVLHNIRSLRNEPIDEVYYGNDQPDIVPFHGPENGKVVREYICNTYF